jgi:N-acyl homoserine lactone hydrolase
MYRKENAMSTPLSGPQRLYLMQVASVPPVNLPIVCYLVQTADGKNVLIDTGLPSGPIQPPPGLQQPVLGKNVIEQLALIGLQPENIDLLVCTHFDLDHTGHHAEFPRAKFVVQRRDYDAALENPRFAASRPRWDQPLDRFQFVDGDTQLLPGLDLIETSGHTPGHQSVLVRLPESGPVLLAIDAVPQSDLFTLDRQAGPMDDDVVALRTSTQKLLDMVKHQGVHLVIFGHDGRQWDTLKKLPEPYC